MNRKLSLLLQELLDLLNSKDYVGTVECEEGKVGFGIAMTLWLNDDAGSEIAITSRKKLTQLLSCDENQIIRVPLCYFLQGLNFKKIVVRT